MLGDDSLTLRPVCQEAVEAEANFAAGRLLFLRKRFTDEARSLEPSIEAIQALREIFGNMLSTTLYRVVESFGVDRPLVGMISGHPHASRRRHDFDPSSPCRHFIQSPAFRRHFGKTSEVQLFGDVSAYCGPQGGGPLGEDELILTDDNPHASRRRHDFDPSSPCRHFIQSPAFRRHFGKTSEVQLFGDVSAYCGPQGGGPAHSDRRQRRSAPFQVRDFLQSIRCFDFGEVSLPRAQHYGSIGVDEGLPPGGAVRGKPRRNHRRCGRRTVQSD